MIKIVNLKQLESELETNDISFSYKGEEYVICPLDKFYAGEAGNDDDKSFVSFDEMVNKWVIQGHIFKDIIPEIELL
jgi:hypothetical protein